MTHVFVECKPIMIECLSLKYPYAASLPEVR
jgi:hypothetical protein